MGWMTLGMSLSLASCAAGTSYDGESGAAGAGSSSIEGAGNYPGGSLPGASCSQVKVTTSGADLNVRPTPDTSGAPVGSLANGTVVDVLSETDGEAVNGMSKWYEIQSGTLEGYVSAAYAVCAPTVTEDVQFYLPFKCGFTTTISQGNGGTTSHGVGKKTEFAFDFRAPADTPIMAMADGVVAHVFDETVPGDPCYLGGGAECYAYANLVVLRHADGTTTLYKHLNGVRVAVGDSVVRGERIGRSGTTGQSTGPHLHLMRQEDCGQANCQSIPMKFEDVPGSGVPADEQEVTSGNCK